MLAHFTHANSNQPIADHTDASAIWTTVRHIAFIAAIVLFMSAFALLRLLLSMRGLP